MNRVGVLLGLLLVTTHSGADASPAMGYLKQMGSALQNLNYHGTIIYSHGGLIESMQVVHKSGPNGEFERLVHLSGAPREVIRSNDTVTCYMSDSQSVMVGKRNLSGHLLSKLGNDFDSYSNTYSFSLAGEGRVAGKSAHMIQIDPKDQYRYGYRLWLSKSDALLLKSELIDPLGEVLEQFMFAQVDVVDFIPDAMLKPAISGESFTWHREKIGEGVGESPDTQLRWSVPNLPAGFKLTNYTKQQMPNTKAVADHIVISDGLASVSVYIEHFSAESQPFVGASHMGAVNIYGAVLGDFQVTVVGEVPPPTVKMIAESVAAQGKGAGG